MFPAATTLRYRSDRKRAGDRKQVRRSVEHEHSAGVDGIQGGVELDAHADHRLIEAFVAVGLATHHPITISNAFHIAKSYPQFFDDLIELGARIERVF